jgi:predicted DNA-binding transcriptional regulator AlpA
VNPEQRQPRSQSRSNELSTRAEPSDQADDRPSDAAACDAPAGHSSAIVRIPGDALMTISDIRQLFKLGRTAAYELTRRAGFPAPVYVSSRCYRWWASEVTAFAGTISREPTVKKRASAGVIPAPLRASLHITGQSRPARRRKDQHDSRATRRTA